MQARIQPSPSALIYKAANSRVEFQPWTSLQLLLLQYCKEVDVVKEGGLVAQAVRSPAQVSVLS